MNDPTETANEDFCISCGVCCDGSILSFGQLADDDPMLPGMTPYADKGGSGFAQPCPYFDGCCTTYATRPRLCRRYACGLLKALKAGTVSRPEADAALTRLRARRAELARHLPDAATNAPLAMEAFAETFRNYPDMQAFLAENTATMTAMRALQAEIDLFRHGPTSY